MKRQHIPWAIRRELWHLPCVVCGVPWSIRIDHIIPVAVGGPSQRWNLQPLCEACNHAKSHRHTTEFLFEHVRRLGRSHFLRAAHRESTKFDGFDALSLDRWMPSHPEQVAHADRLHAAFLERLAERLAERAPEVPA